MKKVKSCNSLEPGGMIPRSEEVWREEGGGRSKHGDGVGDGVGRKEVGVEGGR